MVVLSIIFFMCEEKKHIQTSDGVAKLFGMSQSDENSAVPQADKLNEIQANDSTLNSSEHTKKVSPPVDLPIFGHNEVISESESRPGEFSQEALVNKPNKVDLELPKELGIEPLEPLPNFEQGPKSNFPIKLVKTILPYIAIFAVGLGLYFFYFSDFSFNSLVSDEIKLESLTTEDRDKNLEQLKKEVAKDYNVWIAQFFTGVTDESIIDMDTDVSGNGLSNLEKYFLNLNPKVYSTQGGVSDGQLVIEDINPWTGRPFTSKQKELVEKYIYKELISNRITAAALTRGVTKFAQYVNPDSPYYIDPETLTRVGNGRDSIISPVQISPEEYPASSLPVPTTPPPAAPASGQQNLRPEQGIDTSKPALLEIPSLKISTPVIWTKAVKDFDADLKKGVVHYPGTALPGDIGLAYISGHSSGYAWDKSPYKQIFAPLGRLENGASFSISATSRDGRPIKFNYVVVGKGEYAANDQAQFLSTAESQVALSTCWPIGTVDRRLVVYARLSQTER